MIISFFGTKKTFSLIIEKTEIKELADNCFNKIIKILLDKEQFVVKKNIKALSLIIQNSIIIINTNILSYEISKFCFVEPKRRCGKK